MGNDQGGYQEREGKRGENEVILIKIWKWWKIAIFFYFFKKKTIFFFFFCNKYSVKNHKKCNSALYDIFPSKLKENDL